MAIVLLKAIVCFYKQSLRAFFLFLTLSVFVFNISFVRDYAFKFELLMTVEIAYKNVEVSCLRFSISVLKPFFSYVLKF